jgi:hypothetical protein
MPPSSYTNYQCQRYPRKLDDGNKEGKENRDMRKIACKVRFYLTYLTPATS